MPCSTPYAGRAAESPCRPRRCAAVPTALGRAVESLWRRKGVSASPAVLPRRPISPHVYPAAPHSCRIFAKSGGMGNKGSGGVKRDQTKRDRTEEPGQIRYDCTPYFAPCPGKISGGRRILPALHRRILPAVRRQILQTLRR